ncbi:ferrochelatase [Frankia nepalensis]|uniref:ferrochelatase n=1 Tax=Frankia nepalensis TaxID=1836974 RepID=UPI0019312892|nr:ferrochelatase [Frankia nepalensis]MBL7512854.1 ferrochelatase [Frankia nepalensis]
MRQSSAGTRGPAAAARVARRPGRGPVERGERTAGAGRPGEAEIDAVLLVTFGGPDEPADVLPFLRNVTRGRGVPEERIAQVAEHYHQLGGRSPINDQSRELLAALRDELAPLPVYWGNRNWRPYLRDALAEMRADGVRLAACFIPSVFSTYSGCRQYRENLAEALDELGAAGEPAPAFVKLRVFFNHPGFLEPMADRVQAALETLPADRRDGAHLVFVAHSVPRWQAVESGPAGGAYERQLLAASRTVARLLAERRGREQPWDVAYCSRSGSPRVPWLEPDVGDCLERLAAEGAESVVIVPIGFVSDHMEVIQDLDREALARAGKLGLTAARAGTVGADPRFVQMIVELVEERRDPSRPRRALGELGSFPDVCPLDCCGSPATEDRRPAMAGLPEDALGRGRYRRGAAERGGPATAGGPGHSEDGRRVWRTGILDEELPDARPGRPDRR